MIIQLQNLLIFFVLFVLLLIEYSSGETNNTESEIPLCYSFQGTSSVQVTSNCVPPNLFVLNSVCGPYVSYLLPNDLNQTLALQQASFYAFYNRNRRLNCPFYTREIYQCYKYFPRCEYNITANSNTNSLNFATNNDTNLQGAPNAYVRPLCKSTCLQALFDDNNYCDQAFSDQYFAAECDNTCFYVDNNVRDNALYCYHYDLSVLTTVSAAEQYTWKIVTGCLLGGLALILLISTISKKCGSASAKSIKDHTDKETSKLYDGYNSGLYTSKHATATNPISNLSKEYNKESMNSNNATHNNTIDSHHGTRQSRVSLELPPRKSVELLSLPSSQV